MGSEMCIRDRHPAEQGLPDRLAGLTTAERSQALVELVREHVAAVLGHATATDIGPEQSFSTLGFDSLTAVELRNQLAEITGVRLPTTLVFDYPSPESLAGFLGSVLSGREKTDEVSERSAVTADEPIAIIGMSCRYPGDVGSPEDLWDMVVNNREGIAGFPTDRGWDLEALYDPEGAAPGTTYVRESGFLYGAADFDAGFFGVGPREALAMDPQHRLLLELSWEVLERAGLDATGLRGSRTGVFSGLMHHDYVARLQSVPEEVAGYLSNGNAGSVASGRVAYTFGFEGPAVTVDTACSSSLVALDMAVTALQRGSCDLALAGGVAVVSTPAAFTEFTMQRGLAADGRCKAFAGSADGTAWSEGVGVLLVERLSDARRNGHRVLAVVRGTAVNQDGASNGMTAPNGPSQQRVIRQALANAGLAPSDVDVVEAHGTGTALGDPIEAQALIATYGQDRPQERPVLLGSVKSNLGHTQAAAGVAGIIKMVMAMRHGTVPATLHVDEPSPHVDWSAGAVELATEARSWPETDRPRRAAVSSFGISGTNAHVILEQAPEETPPAGPAAEPVIAGGAQPWVLSARSAAALRGQAQRLREFTLGPVGAGAQVDEVAGALAGSRTVFGHRAVVLAADRSGFTDGLAVLSGADADGATEVVHGVARPGAKVAFVFPGGQPVRADMITGLTDSSPVFAASLAQCGEALAPHTGWDLLDVLRDRPDALDDPGTARPVLWAVMVALAELWRSVGVTAGAVVGLAGGEIAAACVAGTLSLADGAALVTAPAGSQALPGSGSAPVYAAGAVDADRESPGGPPPLAEVLDLLFGDGVDTFVEVSPHPVTTAAVEEAAAAAGREVVVVGSLLRGEDGRTALVRSAAVLWTGGVGVDWPLLAPSPGHAVELPTYAFQHKRYWLDAPESSGDSRVRQPAGRELPRAEPAEDILARVREADPDKRRRVLEDVIRTEVAEVLRHEDAEDIALDIEFLHLGVDSLAGLTLRERLEELLKVEIGATAMFDHPTTARLAARLADLVGDGAEEAVGTPTAPRSPFDSIEALYRESYAMGQAGSVGMDLVQVAARIRPSPRANRTGGTAACRSLSACPPSPRPPVRCSTPSCRNGCGAGARSSC